MTKKVCEKITNKFWVGRTKKFSWETINQPDFYFSLIVCACGIWIQEDTHTTILNDNNHKESLTMQRAAIISNICVHIHVKQSCNIEKLTHNKKINMVKKKKLVAVQQK